VVSLSADPRGSDGANGKIVYVWIKVKGGLASPCASTGQSGMDGSRGHDGSGGAAGKIIAQVEKQAERYLDKIHLSTSSGNGMSRSKPVIQITPVRCNALAIQ